VIYALLFALFCLTLHAQDEPLPNLGISPETVIKANTLSRAIEKLADDFNGNWKQGQHVEGGCYGDWIEYTELIKIWNRLTIEQAPGTLNIELVRVKHKMVEVVEALSDCLKLITDDLKKMLKATKALPPK